MLGQTITGIQRKSVIKLLANTGLVLAVAFGFMLLTPASAGALSGQGPDPVDFGGQPGERFGYSVATPSLMPGATSMSVPIYFDDAQGSKTIVITGGNLCSDDIETAPTQGGNDRDISYNPAANPVGSLATQFYMRNSTTNTNYGEVFSSVSDSNTCFGDKMLLTFDAASALTLNGTLDKYVGYFHANISGTVVDAVNRFSITAESTSIIGFSASNTSQSTSVSRMYPYAGFNNFHLPFGLGCEVEQKTRVAAELFDMDNGDPIVQEGQQMKIYVEQIAGDGSKTRIPLIFTNGGGQTPNTQGDAQGYTVASGNNEILSIGFDVSPGYKYALAVTEVGYKNGLQFKLPFDSIYATTTACDPPTRLNCGVMTPVPITPEVNEDTVVRGTFRFNSATGETPVNHQIQVRNRSGNGSPGIVPSTMNLTGNTITITSAPFVMTTAEMYTVQWSVKVGDIEQVCGGGFLAPDSFLVLAHPFFVSRGGDVVAGSSFSTDTDGKLTTCTDAVNNPKAGVVSWNRGRPTYQGAGSQYATFAMSFIQGFITNQGSARAPTSLSFSNFNDPSDGLGSIDIDSGWYGGLFGKAPCVNYWGSRPSDASLIPLPNNPPLATLPSNKYRFNGPLTIGPNSIPNGRQLTIYVQGDVNITGDITYQGNGDTRRNSEDISVLKLIVQGRIFVNHNVNRLDGLYAAIPDGGYVEAVNTYAQPIDGTISTCSNGFNSFNPTEVVSNQMVSICNRRLTVNGSFVANQILLLRTFGTLSTNQPAEVFNYNPEMWLAPSDNDSHYPEYRAITGLPPIL